MIGKVIAFPFLLGLSLVAIFLVTFTELFMVPLCITFSIIHSLWKEESIINGLKDTWEFLIFPYTMVGDIWK